MVLISIDIAKKVTTICKKSQIREIRENEIMPIYEGLNT